MGWFKKAVSEEPKERKFQLTPVIRVDFHLIGEKWAVGVEIPAEDLDIDTWMENLSRDLEKDKSLWLVDRFGKHWMFYKSDIKYFTLKAVQAVTLLSEDSDAESI